MTAVSESALVQMDHQASTPREPYGIITADCSNPREIDDGIFVEALDADQETYRVGVCVADTSSTYHDEEIFDQAMRRTEAKYWLLRDGELGYDPMLDIDVIKGLEFSVGNVRDALVVSFTVGKQQPVADVDVSFGKVEVTENLGYKDFSIRTQSEETYRKYARASKFIRTHLAFTSWGDRDRRAPIVEEGDGQPVEVSEMQWRRGSKLNEAFMIGAYSVVGTLLAEENRPAIYRLHDPADARYIEFLPPDMALYGMTPGRHAGLNLDNVCRVTSPLRRLEDWMMSYQLKQRYLGIPPTEDDVSKLTAAVQRLNGNIMRAVFEGPLRLSRRDTLGKGRTMLGGAGLASPNLVALHSSEDVAATA